MKWNIASKKFDTINNMIPLTEEQEKIHQETTKCNWCKDEFKDTKETLITPKRKGVLNKLAVCQVCFPKVDDRHNCHKHGETNNCCESNISLYKNHSKEEKELLIKNPNCSICEKEFGKEYKFDLPIQKVRHHNHFTGEFVDTLCHSCNITEGYRTKFVPIYAHNLSGYDSHLFIKELACEITKYNEVKVLPKTKESYISFTYGCLRFLDSLRQFGMSLDEVAKSMVD
jgi:hypothetical protein